MAQFKTTMVVFAVLSSGSQVHSDKVKFSTKSFQFGNKVLIVGDKIIDKRTLVYALCETEHSKTLDNCTVKFHTDVFSNEEPKSCEIQLPTKHRRNKLQHFKINNWIDNKVILMWQEHTYNFREASVTLYIMRMDTCNKIGHEKRISSNRYLILELFYFPYRNCFDILFMITDASNQIQFSQWTIFENGEIKQDKSSFTQTGLAYAFEPIDDSTSKLLLMSGASQGQIDIYLMDDDKKRLLGQHSYVRHFGLSTTNGIISYCALESCIQFDYRGEQRGVKTLDLLFNPAEYLALYNLVNGQILALICDGQPRSPYRVIRIGSQGEQAYSYKLEGSDCQNKSSNLRSIFYVKSNTKYCLSLFHSINTSAGGAKFSEYCFSI